MLAPIAPIKWPLWLSPTTPLSLQAEPTIQFAVPLLIASGVIGVIIGGTIQVRQAWKRSSQVVVRFFQDLFAYDFYVDRLYEVTVVAAVSFLAKLTSWIDRYVIDGAVNLISLATIFGGNALKYNVTGQSQFYILTIILGVGLLLWLLLNGQWSIVTDYWSSFIS